MVLSGERANPNGDTVIDRIYLDTERRWQRAATRGSGGRADGRVTWSTLCDGKYVLLEGAANSG